VAEFTRRYVLARYRVAPDAVATVYPGVGRLAELDAGALVGPARSLCDAWGRYVLTVSSGGPNKNLPAALEAVRLARERLDDGFQLVVVGFPRGAPVELLDLATRLGLQREIVFAGGVSDEILAGLYAGAEAFLFPSRFEGFGLPPVEAMALGAPVAASDRSALPEVLGDAAGYFDPDRPESIADTLVRLLADDELRATLRKAGRVRAQRYSWTSAARRLMAVFEGMGR